MKQIEATFQSERKELAHKLAHLRRRLTRATKRLAAIKRRRVVTRRLLLQWKAFATALKTLFDASTGKFVHATGELPGPPGLVSKVVHEVALLPHVSDAVRAVAGRYRFSTLRGSDAAKLAAGEAAVAEVQARLAAETEAAASGGAADAADAAAPSGGATPQSRSRRSAAKRAAAGAAPGVAAIRVLSWETILTLWLPATSTSPCCNSKVTDFHE